MKKSLILITVVFISYSISFGQEVISKKFFNDENGYYVTSENAANFYELTIKEPNKIICYELRNKKDDKLISIKRFKKNFPVGIWYSTSSGEINHDSILHYDYINKKFIEKVKDKLEAPMLGNKDDSFERFVTYRLHYPDQAAMNGIQGKVISQFMIDEEGNLTNFSIIKSVNEYLDKESARVIMLSPKWTPAKLNGKPIKVFVFMDTVFMLR